MNRRALTCGIAFVLAFSVMAVVASCGSDDTLPDAARIMQDLIGESIVDPHLGEWVFEHPDEFLDFYIDDQSLTDDRAEFVVVMELKDIGDGRLYRGRSTVVYIRDGIGTWRFASVSGEYRSAGPST